MKRLSFVITSHFNLFFYTQVMSVYFHFWKLEYNCFTVLCGFCRVALCMHKLPASGASLPPPHPTPQRHHRASAELLLAFAGHVLYTWTVKALVAQLCPTLCDHMDCSPPGSSVHGILQARVLEWVAISFSRGSSWPRDRTQVSCIAGGFFTIWAPTG